MDRRAFLRVSAASAVALTATEAISPAPAAAGAATPSARLRQALPPHVGAGSTAPIRPFSLPAVRLGASIFREKQDRMLAFARQYDERRFLVLFNTNAGRPNPSGVSPPGGCGRTAACSAATGPATS